MLSLCLLICYLPPALLSLWSVLTGDRRAVCGDAQFYARSFSQLIVVINSAIKMLLLLIFVPRFRHAVRRLCCCSTTRVTSCNSSRRVKVKAMVNSDEAMMSSLVQSSTEGGVGLAPRFTPYRCSDSSEMTLMSSVASTSSGPARTPSYIEDDATFWE
jgi:hypothetical protein